MAWAAPRLDPLRRRGLTSLEMARAVVAPKNGIEKPPRRRRGPVGSDSSARARTTKKRIIEASRRWLRIINAHRQNEQERQRVVAETGGGQFAAVEWSGKGSCFEDLTGRRFIDCLGGYGIYSAGINHPKIVRAVKSPLDRMPLSSQELLDPLRGALAELLGELA